RLFELSRILSAELLVTGKLATDLDQAFDQLDAAWSRGQVSERFGRMVSALGGPADLIERPEDHLQAAPLVADLFPAQPGIVQQIDVRALGLAVIELGGGRHQASDPIDMRVGLSDLALIGDAVDGERALMRVHARSQDDLDSVTSALRDAFILGDHERLPPPLTHAL
ncbi:MAG: thymidine phosphorylase, partial [Pseudomonadota bacterium]